MSEPQFVCRVHSQPARVVKASSYPTEQYIELVIAHHGEETTMRYRYHKKWDDTIVYVFDNTIHE